MAAFHFNNVEIAGLACAVPEFSQPINLDHAHPAATYNANFAAQTGIQQRYISIYEQTGADLGYVALAESLKRANWEAQTLDGLIFLTQTPDFNMATGNAFLLHKHLAMPSTAFVFDVAQGCAAFPYGLSIAGAYLQQQNINRMALVIGDVMWPSYADKKQLLEASTFLTGDGVAAILLEKTPRELDIDIELYSDGSGYHFLYDPWGGTRHAWRRNPGRLANNEPYSGGPYMDGLEITTFATMRVVDDIKNFLGRRDEHIDEYDSVVLHQANMQILKAMRRRLKISQEKFPVSVDRFANTNGASVLLTLADAYGGQEGVIRVLASAFGIGLSWGIAAFSIDKAVIAPIVFTAHRFEEDFLRRL